MSKFIVGQVCPTEDLKIGYKNKREKGIFQRCLYNFCVNVYKNIFLL